MTSATATGIRTPRVDLKRILLFGVPLVLLVAMALSTKVVDIHSAAGAGPKKFDPATYGKTEFPKVQQAIEKRAVPAEVLAKAIAADPSAAGKHYGVPGGTGPEFAVSLTGVAGKPDSGIYPLSVSGLPKDLVIRVQTGPAINGTDLRDGTGTIKFGQFTNQIEYQNAASALNNEMKKQVLAEVDAAKLTGKTLNLVGVFQLINPKGWLITPAKLSVQ